MNDQHRNSERHSVEKVSLDGLSNRSVEPMATAAVRVRLLKDKKKGTETIELEAREKFHKRTEDCCSRRKNS